MRTKMAMIWVASLIYPEVGMTKTIASRKIIEKVKRLFAESITPVMVTRRLVSHADKMADTSHPQRARLSSHQALLASVWH